MPDLRMERNHSAIFCMVNLHYLEEITDASPTSMLEIINVFLKIVPVELERIRTLIEQQKVSELSVAIHKLRPKYHYVGVCELNEPLAQMQEKIPTGELSDCMHILEKVERTTFAAIDELQKVKESLHRELQITV